MKQNLLCIDFLNLLYKSFYALSQIRASDGTPTGAIYGCVKTLKKIIKKYAITEIVICNEGESILKKIELPFYKAHRESTPKELLIQKKILLEYFQKIEIPVLSFAGYEADDLIHDICKKNNIFGKKNIFILSSDKDLHPLLLLENTKIIDSNKEIILDKEWLYQKYESRDLTKEKLFLFLALAGDSSDNVPGVKNVGPKTALKIISEYHSLDEIYQAIESGKDIISKKITTSFLENKEQAYQSFFLIEPQTIGFENKIINSLIENTTPWEYHNFAKGNKILQQHECHSLISEDIDLMIDGSLKLEENSKEIIEEKQSLPYAKNQFEKKTVQNETDFLALASEIKNSQYIAIDTETTSGDPRTTTIIGFSIATTLSHAWYIPLVYQGEKSIYYELFITIFNEIPQNSLVIMHNALFDLHVLKTIGVNIRSKLFDTMITAFILKEVKIGLKELSTKLLKERMESFFDIISAQKVKRFDEIEITKASSYAATDARQTLSLYHHFIKKLSDKNMTETISLLENIEMPLIKVLFHIESQGIYCDKTILREEESKYLSLIDKVHEEIKNFAAEKNFLLNPMSHKQTGKFLYEVLQIPHTGKKYSTDQLTLSMIEHLHPIVPLIILYRSLQSTISHFTTGLLKYIDEKNKIYTHYQQYVTHTGRITTINPNLQNIPKTNDFFKIRSAFHAAPAHFLMSFDYSQIEIRVLANISQDPTLVGLLLNKEDMHNLTAEKIFQKQISEITPEERQIAKKINFSVLYGQGSYNLSRELKISLTDARRYLSIFEETYPGIFSWKNRIIEKAKEVGYVTTTHGLRRNIPELLDTNKIIFKSGCRIAINTIIQGTAAEIMKKAMIEVFDYLEKTKKGHIVLQIHDEILVELSEKNIDKSAAEIKKIMEEIELSTIPYAVSVVKDTKWN